MLLCRLQSQPTTFSRFSFLFYCYRALRYLHSFPTRRSSDLVHRIRRHDRRDLHQRPCGSATRGGRPTHLRFRLSVLCVRVRDRKSTRLNSSHITISYAVFCLKKKNNYDEMLSIEIKLSE